MLDAGVTLYEVRHDAAMKASVVDTAPITAKFMGLHAKSAVIDRRAVIVGSANFDPRSAFINSEMVAFIDSEALAVELAEMIERDTLPANSWQSERDDRGSLVWRSGDEILMRQPTRNGWQWFQDFFLCCPPKSSISTPRHHTIIECGSINFCGLLRS